MVDNFHVFARIVQAELKRLSKGQLFRVDVSGDDVYAAYLAAFPSGTNPIYRETTEHDCSCCKSFIRNIGNAVKLNQKAVKSIWCAVAEKAPYPYDVVASELAKLVQAAKVKEPFLVKESSYGTKVNYGQGTDNQVITWNHLYTGDIACKYVVSNPGEKIGFIKSTVDVLRRGLLELELSALDEVLELISSKSLYRGEEHLSAVTAFRKHKVAWERLDEKERNLYLWNHASNPASRFRNSVIGTLVQDLSAGKGVERSVAAFEAKVAPSNYQRPKALITSGMVSAAMKTIEALGLEPALERRLARIEDISVQDVLWVNSDAKPHMKEGGLRGKLEVQAKATPKSINRKKLKVVGMPDFISTVLPGATTVEVLFEPDKVQNLVALTAPVHPEPKKLFQWDNDFAWSYVGGVADSKIKARVKAKGGVVDGVLRFSLSWFNYDDLDLHALTPSGHIYFSQKKAGGGRLDVDMNVNPVSREAVENIYWKRVPENGNYTIFVRNFTKRESVDVGFVVEMEHEGKVIQLSYSQEVTADVEVASFSMQNGAIEDFKTTLSTQGKTKSVWGLQTGQFVPVNAITYSPNYWGELSKAKGNKHTFFLLAGAKNEEPTRGIYNEFLDARLVKHRKVFEVIGNKTLCEPSEDQLSGLGFSSTRQAEVVVRVKKDGRTKMFCVRSGK